jgi:Ankyrin repeats (3 copies)/Homeodomain-like domain
MKAEKIGIHKLLIYKTCTPQASDRELARVLSATTDHRNHHETVKALLDRYPLWRYPDFQRLIQYQAPSAPWKLREEMVKLRQQGWTEKRIAQLLRCSRKTVIKWLRRAPGRVATGRQATLAVRPLTRATSDITQGLFRRDSRRAHSAKEIRIRRSMADQRVLGTGLPHLSKRDHNQKDHGAQSPAVSGDIERLETLLDKHPWLARYHCQKGECYEEGYFAGATLLNHIAGNPSRCPIPRNILDITRLLLSRGARDEPPKPKYTIGLLLTSRQASEAGVALPLIDLLIAAGGIEIDLTHQSILNDPLRNEAPATALALIRRGAKMDIRHAAALGRLDLVKCFLDGDDLHANVSLVPLPEESGEAKAQLEQAFIWACQCGQNSVSEFLLEQGVDPAAQANVGQTGLHYAAHCGHLETVKMLIARKSPLEVKNMYGGTVLGQALWSAFNEPQDDHLPIVEALIAAGAKIDPDWNKWIDELRQRHGAKS